MVITVIGLHSVFYGKEVDSVSRDVLNKILYMDFTLLSIYRRGMPIALFFFFEVRLAMSDGLDNARDRLSAPPTALSTST